MKKRQGAVVDLHYDILKEILIRVARSSDGAKTFATAISVCKAFRRFVEDGDVLRAVVFDDLFINDRWELFPLKEGLICRCAQAGQEQAQFILAKIILVSTSEMLGAKMHQEKEAFSPAAEASNDNLPKQNTQAASFLETSFPVLTSRHVTRYDHFKFVKLFLSRASASEFLQMKSHLDDYMKYFIRCREYDQFAVHMFSGLLFGVEVKLTSSVVKFYDQLTEMRVRVHVWMWIHEVEIEQVDTMEERQICGHGAETFDMLLKRLWAMVAAVGEASGTTQHPVKEDAGFDLKSFYQAFSREAMKLESEIKAWKSLASAMEDSRACLASEFEGLALCQLTTEHTHNFDTLFSNLVDIAKSIE